MTLTLIMFLFFVVAGFRCQSDFDINHVSVFFAVEGFRCQCDFDINHVCVFCGRGISLSL